MYSILPAVISIFFLGFGFFAIASRGIGRVSASFFLMCVTTFFWQSTWAVLFQVRDPAIALFLVKFGYFFILFLPTSLYHFLTEISGYHQDRSLVYISYALALVLAFFLPGSNLFVSGYYQYYWGYYPKAGLLHPVHLLQTVVVVNRGLYITYTAQKFSSPDLRMRLRFCIAGVLIFFFAAIDYLCNYGIEFYPPGVVFIALSLGIFMVAILKYDLLNPMTLAASVAHEIRTPLASIRNQATGISRYLPELLRGYQLAVDNRLMESGISDSNLNVLSGISERITNEVHKSNVMIDMMLASTSMENSDAIVFERFSAGTCIAEALERYPFEAGEREKVIVSNAQDFEFFGSDTLLVFVLFNLLKNSINALKESGKGEIHLQIQTSSGRNLLSITDTGTGIPKGALPHIFDMLYSSRQRKGGTGLGLSFCKKVMEAFKGSIRCDSVEGHYTTITLEFPKI